MVSDRPSRELALCGLFGAAALVLPFLFHLVHLGSLFLPMYLPLVTLALLVRPAPAAVTAVVTPLLSTALTGMPPFWPPISVLMAIELGVMAALLSALRQRWPRGNVLLVLVPVLGLGRLLSVGLVYAAARAMTLPAPFLASVSFLSGWPGVVLMLVAVPGIVRLADGHHAAPLPSRERGHMSPSNPRSAFFDEVALQWDGWHDLPALEAELAAGLAELGVSSGETVVDVGCGTGNLVKALLRVVGEKGHVVALDISPGMLRAARGKNPDERVSWHLADAVALPLEDGGADRLFYLCVWPHLEAPREAIDAAWRALRAGGHLHVWHLMNRERVNEVHASGGEAIRRDRLPPAIETAQRLKERGFELTQVVDDERRYLVSAMKRLDR